MDTWVWADLISRRCIMHGVLIVLEKPVCGSIKSRYIMLWVKNDLVGGFIEFVDT